MITINEEILYIKKLTTFQLLMKMTQLIIIVKGWNKKLIKFNKIEIKFSKLCILPLKLKVYLVKLKTLVKFSFSKQKKKGPLLRSWSSSSPSRSATKIVREIWPAGKTVSLVNSSHTHQHLAQWRPPFFLSGSMNNHNNILGDGIFRACSKQPGGNQSPEKWRRLAFLFLRSLSMGTRGKSSSRKFGFGIL